MDPNELLKAAPELQKIVATIVAGVPIAEIVKAIVLPSADALGKRMANRVERLFEKTGKMVQAAGSPVQEVPEKILIPILQGVALEDDEAMHTMWAALLANAASPENAEKVRPGFIAILKQMAPDEAELLDWIYHQSVEESQETGLFTSDSISLEPLIENIETIQETDEHDLDYFAVPLNGLQAVYLVAPSTNTFASGTDAKASLTHRGFEFVRACRPPKPKS